MMQTPFRPRPEDLVYLRRLGWTIAIGLALVAVWRALDLLMLAFGSVIGAVVFRSAARLAQKAGVRNWHVALSLGILFVLTLFGLMGWLLTVEFGKQLSQFLTDLPGAVAKLTQGLKQSPVGSAIVAAGQAATGGSSLAGQLGKLSIGAGEILLNFIIVTVGGIFIATDPTVYQRGILLLTPRAGRPLVAQAIHEIRLALRLWLNAQLICMTTMGLLVAGALWLIGLQSWGALGLLAALSEFVPYVGPTLAMLPAIAIAAGHGGDDVMLVIAAYFVVRMIQSNLITPFVTRRVVAIPPALTLFVILMTGAIFGIYGLFFSAALLVVLFVGVRELYLRDTLGEEDIEAIPHRKRISATSPPIE